VNAVIPFLLAVGLAFGPPADPPPKVGGTFGGGPPPAWIEIGTRSGWLAYGSYCWRTACVDMVPPESRSDLPRIKVRPRQMLRVHLGFTPALARVHMLRGDRAVAVPSTRGRRSISFRARRGILMIAASASRGTPSYLARLV
jgi:hypothetical protein